MRIQEGTDFVQQSTTQLEKSVLQDSSNVRYVTAIQLGQRHSMKLKVTDNKKCYTWKSSQLHDLDTLISMNSSWMERLQACRTNETKHPSVVTLGKKRKTKLQTQTKTKAKNTANSKKV
ncbi:hypothetical protein HMI54_013919 [Coelomomyces lativittatus]|nr:hypothetical protein HMI55_007241 [Coelomomyces lativittatus]KAJ1514579.1 hypothetical protein HMI54_013919 [Coelomomyces lativittatus]